MSELGLCSRREADEWIENGWVKVDGEVVDTLGTRVSPHARIEVDKAAAQHQSEQVTIILNKPMGYVSGQPEDGHKPAMVLIRPENRWAEDPSPLQFQPAHLRGLAPAGRLDIDSTGLHRVHAGRPHRQAADRRRLGGREGIPGARGGHAVRRAE